MNNFTKITIILLIGIFLLLLFSCKTPQNIERIKKDRKVDRDEIIVLFGDDALYPPEEFGNNEYYIAYDYFDNNPIVINSYDPYAKNYCSTNKGDSDKEISFLCKRGETGLNKLKDIEFPSEKITDDGSICYMLIIKEVKIIHGVSTTEASSFFDFKGHYYMIQYTNYDYTEIDVMESEPIKFIIQLFEDYNFRQDICA